MGGPWSLVGRPQHEAVAGVIAAAKCDLVVACPFVTLEGAEFLLGSCRQRPRPRLRLLTCLTVDAAFTRRCDPAALRLLVETWEEAQFVSLPGLHAKVLVADQRAALVTSANLTRSGLYRNYEYGVLLRASAVVRGILSDLSAYVRVGTPLTKDTVTRVEGIVARTGAVLSPRVPAAAREALEEALLTAHVGGRAPTAVFAEAVWYVLGRDGPLPTTQIHRRVQSLHPELCDDTVDRVIAGKRFGKKWKHLVRSAQQHLRRAGEAELVRGQWRRTDTRHG